MTPAEIFMGGPLAAIITTLAITAALFLPLLIIGFPLFLLNVYRDRKQSKKTKISEIFVKTYF